MSSLRVRGFAAPLIEAEPKCRALRIFDRLKNIESRSAKRRIFAANVTSPRHFPAPLGSRLSVLSQENIAND